MFVFVTDPHMLGHKQLKPEPNQYKQIQAKKDKRPTNCPAVYLAVLGFVDCKKKWWLEPVCWTKGNRSQGGGQSESCVLLIMGRRVLAFNLMEQGHGNRCEGGSRAGAACA